MEELPEEDFCRMCAIAARECKVVLSMDNDYLFANKPADCRLDGKFPGVVTLERMCQSVLGEQKERMNGVKVRFCHQLDYATSGVLCVARSRKAAADACKLFADRKTTKEYLAILDGHVPFPELLCRRGRRLET